MDSAILGGEENFLLWKEKESLADGANSLIKGGGCVDSLSCGKNPSMQNQGCLVDICFRIQEEDVHKQWVAIFTHFLHVWGGFQALYRVLNAFIIPYITMQIKCLAYQNMLML